MLFHRLGDGFVCSGLAATTLWVEKTQLCGTVRVIKTVLYIVLKYQNQQCLLVHPVSCILLYMAVLLHVSLYFNHYSTWPADADMTIALLSAD